MRSDKKSSGFRSSYNLVALIEYLQLYHLVKDKVNMSTIWVLKYSSV